MEHIKTAQAARCAPPERKSAASVFAGQLLLYFFGAIILAVILAFVDGELLGNKLFRLVGGEASGGRNLAIALSLVICAGVIAGLSAGARQNRFNRTEYLRLRERWEKSWLCMRCGKTSVE